MRSSSPITMPSTSASCIACSSISISAGIGPSLPSAVVAGVRDRGVVEELDDARRTPLPHRSGVAGARRPRRRAPSAGRACDRTTPARGRACSTKIARGMPCCSASFHAISVCTSTPSTADTTNSARSAACIAAADVADEIGVARRVEEVDLHAVELERRQRERHGDPPALLLGIEVADGRCRPRPCPVGGSPRRRGGAPRPARSCRRHRGRRGRRCGSWPSGTSSPSTPGFASWRFADSTNHARFRPVAR